MPIIVKRKESESNDSLIRRFTRKVQSSGNLIVTKKRQFKERQPNRRKRRQAAIHRSVLRGEWELKLKKGQVEEKKRYGGRPKGRS